jgi:hypothetical protein
MTKANVVQWIVATEPPQVMLRARMDQEIAEEGGPGHRLRIRCVERAPVGNLQRLVLPDGKELSGEVTSYAKPRFAISHCPDGVDGLSLVVRAQNTAPSRAPAGPPPGATSKVADLSGDWAPDPKRGGIGQSLSLSDNGGRQRGE